MSTEPKEKKATGWDNLPLEMKQKVVKEMNTTTRAFLKRVSKAERRLVRMTEALMGEVKLSAFSDDHIELQIPDCGVNLNLRQNGNMCVIERQQGEELKTKSIVGNVREVLMNIFKSIIDSDYNLIRIDTLSIGFAGAEDERLAALFDDTDLRIVTNKLIVFNNNVRAAKKVLERCNERRLSEIQMGNLVEGVIDVNHILEVPQFRNARNCYLYQRTNATDETLLLMQSSIIHIRSNDITVNGINLFIKNWIERDMDIGSRFAIGYSSKFHKCDITDGCNVTRSFVGEKDTDIVFISMGNNKSMRLKSTPHGIFGIVIEGNREDNTDSYKKMEACVDYGRCRCLASFMDPFEDWDDEFDGDSEEDDGSEYYYDSQSEFGDGFSDLEVNDDDEDYDDY